MSNLSKSLVFMYNWLRFLTYYFYPTKADGSAFTNLTNIFTTNTQVSTGTDYYLEITRNSSTSFTVKLYTGSFNGTLIASGTQTIASTITGLRYLKIMEMQPDTPTGVKGIGTIQEIKFGNGITSVNSKPTNVPTDSRFEETDTRKIYYYSPPSPSSSNMEDSGSWSGSGSLSVANGQIQVRLGGSNAGVSKRDYGTANIDSSNW